MITEDYCSYEVAKLLKEKGFDIPCMGRYSVRSKEFHLDCTKMCNNGGLFEYAAPSQAMAMKWLREIHDLIIYVKLVNDGDLYHDAWGFVIYNKFTNEYIKSDKLCFKYEEACEEAILYCLKNLI